MNRVPDLRNTAGHKCPQERCVLIKEWIKGNAIKNVISVSTDGLLQALETCVPAALLQLFLH